ncbi:hypothetical protein PILCRDRAFT_803130 [Piloderma croceum F 1598]|uniref:Uncharacterized protein n=1 Tax=Piloderma croceum (strain F 1598) TaxID=765440 RepID=A0A0C3B6T2_PILCF|nr:hypothetical protein PILCRDRAFT_803130 [Piloderma croceum F 1598]
MSPLTAAESSAEAGQREMSITFASLSAMRARKYGERTDWWRVSHVAATEWTSHLVSIKHSSLYMLVDYAMEVVGANSSFVLPMSNHSQVTVLYGESKLQKTISLPASAMIATAKKFGSPEILEHLHLQPGVPTDVLLDNECTDFYPDAADNSRLRNLKTQETMVVWPKAAPGSQMKIKGRRSSKQAYCLGDGQCWSEELVTVEKDNVELWATLQTTMEAVIGLIGLRCNQQNPHLNSVGHQSQQISRYLWPQGLEDRGDIAVHALAPKNLGESILTLPEEQHWEDLISIFGAIFNEELAHS